MPIFCVGTCLRPHSPQARGGPGCAAGEVGGQPEVRRGVRAPLLGAPRLGRVPAVARHQGQALLPPCAVYGGRGQGQGGREEAAGGGGALRQGGGGHRPSRGRGQAGGGRRYEGGVRLQPLPDPEGEEGRAGGALRHVAQAGPGGERAQAARVELQDLRGDGRTIRPGRARGGGGLPQGRWQVSEGHVQGGDGGPGPVTVFPPEGQDPVAKEEFQGSSRSTAPCVVVGQ